MKSLAIAAIFSIALFTSCTTGNEIDVSDTSPTTAEGTIVDAISGKTLPNAQVYLSVERKGDQSNFIGGNAMDQQTADDSGHFLFDFKAHYSYNYYIYAEMRGYVWKTGQGSITNGSKNTGIRVEMQPKGYIRFRLHNAPPLDTVAFISLPNVLQEINNLSKDTVIYSYIPARQQTEIDWQIKNTADASIQTYKANIFIQPFDTLEYTINY